jgi:hypothetical protein
VGLLGKGDAGFALDLKFLTLDLRWIIRRKVDSWLGLLVVVVVSLVMCFGTLAHMCTAGTQ